LPDFVAAIDLGLISGQERRFHKWFVMA